MFDSISSERIKLVHPVLAYAVTQLEQMMENDPAMLEGHDTLHVTMGVRTWATQEALFAQGRRGLDEVNALRLAASPPLAPITDAENSKSVTPCQQGYSYHNFGLALDIAPFDHGTIPDWNVNHLCWKRIIQVGESLGMVSGSEFRTNPDVPHFQITGRFPVAVPQEVRDIYAGGGIAAVWKASGLQS